MTVLQKRWQVAPKVTPEAENNLQGYSSVLKQILFNRGISDTQAARNFLSPRYAPHNPYDLPTLGEAVERIVFAIENDQQIVVYGDYDADGVTATALMVQTLQALGANARGYIPNRFDEGYGLNNEALQELKHQQADLVITVDCGIRALEEASYAQEIGLDLVITDHHTPGQNLPSAIAVVNPKHPDSQYPEKNLAGVGTAFKLATALISKLQPPSLIPDHIIDLVAIGTVADLVPLVGENRMLVQRGIEYLRRPYRQGLLSLVGVSGIKTQGIKASHIGFTIGPRLNAAGRIADAMTAYKLLMTKDLFEAGQLAQDLDNRNRERQRITREMQAQADEMARAEDPEASLIFAAAPEFNQGVVGLAAARLVEQYYRPSVVGFDDGEYTKASCRSIPEFHITHALEQCDDLLDHYGGHAAAAGFTVNNKNLPELVSRLKQIADDELGKMELKPVLHADVEIPLDELSFDLLRDLGQLEPTGYGNPEPVFVGRAARVVNSRPVGRDAAHLKMSLTQGKYTFDAIAFRQGHWAGNLPTEIDVAFNFEENEFNGRTNLQLNIRDIQIPS